MTTMSLGKKSTIVLMKPLVTHQTVTDHSHRRDAAVMCLQENSTTGGQLNG